jgi:hypothetical protein
MNFNNFMTVAHNAKNYYITSNHKGIQILFETVFNMITILQNGRKNNFWLPAV